MEGLTTETQCGQGRQRAPGNLSMLARLQWFVCAFVLAFGSLAASYRSPNFVIQAPTPELAQQAAQYAEHYRREKAIQWLGREMPPWPEPITVQIKVTGGGSGGATSFAFDSGAILSQEMEVEGTVDRILASVLPHEITHTVLAHYFRQPVPRWADEGASVLSEDEPERRMHDRMARDILLNPQRRMPLRRLFTITKYPTDVMVLYALGYSVTDFLVKRGGRQQFLTFLAMGMRGDWDGAGRTFYGFDRVETLEAAWLDSLKLSGPLPVELARGTPGNNAATFVSAPGNFGSPNQPIMMGAPLAMDSRGTLAPGWNRESPTPVYLSSQGQGANNFPQPIYAQQPVTLGGPQPGYVPPQMGYPSITYPSQGFVGQGYPNATTLAGQQIGQMISEYPHPPVRLAPISAHPSTIANQDWVGGALPPPPPGAVSINPIQQRLRPIPAVQLGTPTPIP